MKEAGVKCLHWKDNAWNELSSVSKSVHNNNWSMVNVGGTVYWVGGSYGVGDEGDYSGPHEKVESLKPGGEWRKERSHPYSITESSAVALSDTVFMVCGGKLNGVYSARSIN